MDVLKKLSKRELLELYVLADSDLKKKVFAKMLGEYPY